jgi:hypothetical protein
LKNFASVKGPYENFHKFSLNFSKKTYEKVQNDLIFRNIIAKKVFKLCLLINGYKNKNRSLSLQTLRARVSGMRTTTKLRRLGRRCTAHVSEKINLSLNFRQYEYSRKKKRTKTEIKRNLTKKNTAKTCVWRRNS